MSQAILLIRHAQSSGQASDAELTSLGRQQAQDLIPALTDLKIDALFSSPYRRARSTIMPFASANGLNVTILPDLHERILAKQPLPDWQIHIARSFDDLDYACTGGESLNQTAARALKELAVVASSGAARPAVVSHGNLIAAVLNQIGPAFGYGQWRDMANPELFSLILTNGTPTHWQQL